CARFAASFDLATPRLPSTCWSRTRTRSPSRPGERESSPTAGITRTAMRGSSSSTRGASSRFTSISTVCTSPAWPGELNDNPGDDGAPTDGGFGLYEQPDRAGGGRGDFKRRLLDHELAQDVTLRDLIAVFDEPDRQRALETFQQVCWNDYVCHGCSRT